MRVSWGVWFGRRNAQQPNGILSRSAAGRTCERRRSGCLFGIDFPLYDAHPGKGGAVSRHHAGGGRFVSGRAVGIAGCSPKFPGGRGRKLPDVCGDLYHQSHHYGLPVGGRSEKSSAEQFRPAQRGGHFLRRIRRGGGQPRKNAGGGRRPASSQTVHQPWFV